MIFANSSSLLWSVHRARVVFIGRQPRVTVLVEIIRDSKNKYFFQRSRIIMVEISSSRIIRITNYSARTYMYIRASPCAQLHTHTHTHTHVYIGVKEMAAAAICIENDDDVVEPEVENEKARQSSRSLLHCLPDKFRHLGHGPRCDSDGLSPERRPNGL